MTNNHDEREICVWTYSVRPEVEEEFRALLATHWPTLRRLEFVTDEPPIVLRSGDEPPVYVEIVTWEAGGMRPAHEHPDVIPIWERFKALVEERQENHPVPGMSFPFYRRVDLFDAVPSD
jgi:hypothetical protein